ncbi:lipoate--protein ligase family protein [Stetteria hydrogenophila]
MAGRLRVIVDGPRDPRLNMAIDEALARARARVGVDTLRIYTWSPTGVTVGRRQSLQEALRLGVVARRGYVAVRRPTGGAALLHDSRWEVTYSVILSASHPLASLSVPESAAAIAEGVAEAVRILGLPARVRGSPAPSGSNTSSLCLEIPGSSDVLVGGRKVSGSAQARMAGSLLQHGTLMLRLDPRDWAAVIRGATPEAVSRVAAGLAEYGVAPGIPEAVEALVQGFERALDARAEPGSLTGEEVALAVKLYESKYSTTAWSHPPRG